MENVLVDLRNEAKENLKKRDFLFVCFKGVERSRAMVKLAKDRGYKASYFKEGTERLSTLDFKTIEKEIGDNKTVLLIYEEGSSKTGEHQALNIAEDKLEECGIEYGVLGQAELMSLAQKMGGEYYNYLV